MMKLDKNQVCIISDRNEKIPELGTGFLFLRKDWILTAAHVVMEHGLPRQNLYIEFVPNVNEKVILNVKVLAEHKECDIALLQIVDENNPCEFPLYPGHESLSSHKGLIYCGFESSNGDLRIEITEKFSRNIRIRDHEEVIMEFPSEYVTGGYSGGPIFGNGGVVIGLMINQFSDESNTKGNFARATSIKTIMDSILISIDNDRMETF